LNSDNYKPETEFEKIEFKDLITKIRSIEPDKFSEKFDSDFSTELQRLDTSKFKRSDEYYTLFDIFNSFKFSKYRYTIGFAAVIIIIVISYLFLVNSQLSVTEEYLVLLEKHITYQEELTQLDTDENNIIDTYRADLNNDGEFDLFKYDKDENQLIESAACDLNYDGIIDVQILDKDSNGTLEYYVLDVNFDGKFDFSGYDFDNDGKLDRVEQI
jgi:hypothetical protein